MTIQVNQELCTGCGLCVDECSVGAIQLLDQRPVVDDSLCTVCEACMSVCPYGAITTSAIVEPGISIVIPSSTESTPILAQGQKSSQVIAGPVRGLTPFARAALAFLGREVAPRLVDVLVTVLERKLTEPPTTSISPVSTPQKNLASQGSSFQKRMRYRGGRAGKSNPYKKSQSKYQ
jgi:NAD-dependent dihydropyrimidine dehydrogenase PreA subunit